MELDQLYMTRCLQLAQLGASTVSPNPMVGAVIVFEDKIIGEGFTSPYGGPHAEVNAINQVLHAYDQVSAMRMLEQSTVYVSLEPCAHYGKTPPCAELLVKHRIPKVVIACQDPFAKVNGEGINMLLRAGIEVKVGILEEEAKWVNRRFFTRVGQSRPYVILKWGQTKDGFFAPKDRKQQWITNAASKQLVHRWRAEEDAILIGANTGLIDNPSLTVRLWEGKNPKRIVIDRNLSIPESSHVYDDQAETIIFNAKKTDWQGNIKWIELEDFDFYLPQKILYQLYLLDIQSVLIEGGVKTIQMFVDAGLWDEARVFQSNQEWGEGIGAPNLGGLLKEEIKVSDDKLSVYLPRK